MAGPESSNVSNVSNTSSPSTSSAASAASEWSPAEEPQDATGLDEIDRFAQLERLVRSLLSRFEGVREERDALRQELDGRELLVRKLEEELRESNQMRQDVGKRIDDLLTQLDGIVGEEASG